MKIPVFAFGLVVATGVVLADTQTPAPATSNTAKPAATTTTATTPAAKPGAKPTKPKEEAMGTIPGVTIPRADGTFLGLQVVDTKFKLSFYNKKKKPVNMDVTRATIRWPNVRGPGDNRTVLNGSGTFLVGTKPVVPPYTFIAYLTLLKGSGEDEQAVESFTVQFHD